MLTDWVTFSSMVFFSLYIAMLSIYPSLIVYWNGFVHFWSSLSLSLFALSTSLSLSLFQMFVHVMISLFWLHEHFTFYFYYGSLQCNFIASLNPQLIPFSLSTLFKRDAVSFGFLSSYFQVSLPLRIGILSSQEGVALVLGRPQLNLIKFTASGKLSIVRNKFIVLFTFTGVKYRPTSFFGCLSLGWKEHAALGPMRTLCSLCFLVRDFLKTLDDAFYPPFFISFNSYTEFLSILYLIWVNFAYFVALRKLHISFSNVSDWSSVQILQSQ